MTLDDLVQALASALLAGAWNPAAVRERAMAALGGNPRWLAPLVRRVVPLGSPPRRKRLERESLESKGLVDAWPRGRVDPRRALRIHAVLTTPEMGPARWAVPSLASEGDLARWLVSRPAGSGAARQRRASSQLRLHLGQQARRRSRIGAMNASLSATVEHPAAPNRRG